VPVPLQSGVKVVVVCVWSSHQGKLFWNIKLPFPLSFRLRNSSALFDQTIGWNQPSTFMRCFWCCEAAAAASVCFLLQLNRYLYDATIALVTVVTRLCFVKQHAVRSQPAVFRQRIETVFVCKRAFRSKRSSPGKTSQNSKHMVTFVATLTFASDPWFLHGPLWSVAIVNQSRVHEVARWGLVTRVGENWKRVLLIYQRRLACCNERAAHHK